MSITLKCIKRACSTSSKAWQLQQVEQVFVTRRAEQPESPLKIGERPLELSRRKPGVGGA